MQQVKHLILEKNTEGTDYIIGDIHGCYDMVMKLLDHVNFDESKDRLIGTGDLIDRGPKSARCLKLVNEPWFFSVRGNHEDMFINAYLHDVGITNFIMNGGKWTYEGSAEFILMLAELADTLPDMITVKDSFHVIHSQLPYWDVLTDESILAGEHLEYFGSRVRGEWTYDPNHLWIRELFKPVMLKLQDKHMLDYYRTTGIKQNPLLSDIYCGHSVLKGSPARVCNHINLDTGGVFSSEGVYGLCMINHTTKQIFKLSKDGIKEVSLFDLNS